MNKVLNFICYKDNKKVRQLCILFPEMSKYKRYFDKIKCMYFVIKDENFLDKYMKIWENVSNMIKKILIMKLSKIKNI